MTVNLVHIKNAAFKQKGFLQYPPQISVITVSFNHGEFIGDCIESVLAQNYPNFEHIVIDGGSTDNTIEILNRYKHLKWVSEPDKGQTNALNKGFSVASGEIIAWLNSDDWYAPQIFPEVVRRLSNYPILIGRCQITDRQGKPTEVIENVKRNWFDILKHWIGSSIPGQPSIFFRRGLLEAQRNSDGSYLDEDLTYCMDYDLWLRMTLGLPLHERSGTVFSYMRMYETNKTGQSPLAMHREFARVFRRHSNSICRPEQTVSYILPICEINEDLCKTLDSLHQQKLGDYEICLVSYNCSGRQSYQLRKKIEEIDIQYAGPTIRFMDSHSREYNAAVQKGMLDCSSLFGVILESGAVLNENFTLELVNLFSQNHIGLAFPSGKGGGYSHPVSRHSFAAGGVKSFNPDLLNTPPFLANFAFRKVAMVELGGIAAQSLPVYSFKQILFRLLFKGWTISIDNNLLLQVGFEEKFPRIDLWRVFEGLATAQIIVDLMTEAEDDFFAVTRREKGFSLFLSPEIIKKATLLVAGAPSNWHILNYEQDLEAIIADYPCYAPGWYLLAQLYEERGRLNDAEYARSKFLALCEEPTANKISLLL